MERKRFAITRALTNLKAFFYLCCIYILFIPLGKFNTILIIIVFNINYLKYP
jgi:hypothetical protein